MNTRNWSIRSKIVALVAVPLSALLALWVFATVLTVGPALNLLSAQTLLDSVGRPGESLVAELQRERRLSLVYLASPGDGTALGQQRTRTDAAIATFRREASAEPARNAASELLHTRIDQLLTSLDALPSGRGFIDRREMDKTGALGLYSGVVDSAFRMFGAMATLDDRELDREAQALTQLGRARELLARADSLLAGAFAAGRFDAGEPAQLIQIIGTQRYLYTEAVAALPGADRTAYQRMTEGEAFVRLRQMQDTVVAESAPGEPVPVAAPAWQGSYNSAVAQLRDFELDASDAITRRAGPLAVQTLARLGIAGVLGLTALIVSLFVSVRVGRSIVRRLGGLRMAALDLADARLPSVVSRLRRGEEVDVAAEAPPLEYGTDEIGQLGRAFTEVQRTAVQSAVDEAAVRRGLNEVFLNIARRSQTLLHRQLAVLDGMERRTADPDELADLFRVDHLATRMRRHAEDLVILAGSTPGRGWRHPVPVVDVLRGAVSEVEDYQRVDVRATEQAAVAGRAVGDVIHLLAELIENATSFSPPHTRVRVTGQPVANGYAVEIEDRGLGMTPEALAEANRRLAEPPEFDPADSARLGLFVVALLGARHGVQVQLRPSPYGGVTAVVLLPSELMELTRAPALPAGPADDRSGRHAAEPAGPRQLTSAAVEPAVPGGLQRRRRTSPRLLPVPAGPAVTAPDAPGASPAGGAPEPSGPDAVGAVPGAARPASDAAGPSGPVRPAAEPVPVGPDGLPRRRRQASLAPQLREPVAAGAAAEPPSARSPEQVRAMMSALQAGTAQGRRDGAARPGPAGAPSPVRRPGRHPGDPVPATLADLDGTPAAAPTVVHGEIIERPGAGRHPADPPPPWPTGTTIDEPAEGGTAADPERDA